MLPRTCGTTGLLASFVVVASTVAFVSRGRDDAVAPDSDSSAESSVVEQAAPALAVPPQRGQRRAAPPDGERPVETVDVPTAVDDSPYLLFGRSDVDDAALPTERVLLAVTLVDSDERPIPRAAVEAIWGEWRTKTYTADAEGRVTMSVPRGARALEVVGVPRSEGRNFLLIDRHSLSGDEREVHVVVTRSSDIVVIEAGDFVCVPAVEPPSSEHARHDGSTTAPANHTELRGRVFDAFGRPAVAAMCVVYGGRDHLASTLTDDDGVYSMTVPRAPGTRIQLSARFPAGESTSRGVVNDIVTGAGEPTVYLEEVGVLTTNPCRWSGRAGSSYTSTASQ